MCAFAVHGNDPSGRASIARPVSSLSAVPSVLRLACWQKDLHCNLHPSYRISRTVHVPSDTSMTHPLRPESVVSSSTCSLNGPKRPRSCSRALDSGHSGEIPARAAWRVDSRVHGKIIRSSDIEKNSFHTVLCPWTTKCCGVHACTRMSVVAKHSANSLVRALCK